MHGKTRSSTRRKRVSLVKVLGVHCTCDLSPKIVVHIGVSCNSNPTRSISLSGAEPGVGALRVSLVGAGRSSRPHRRGHVARRICHNQ